jgi:hypothetical protein
MVELTKLPGWIDFGSTTPLKRSTSEFWRMPICFSPATSRLPLGSTSITVTVIVPVNWLLDAVSPLPSKVLLVLALPEKPLKLEPSTPLTAGMVIDTSLLRSALELAFWLALSFSLIWIVSRSPM